MPCRRTYGPVRCSPATTEASQSGQSGMPGGGVEDRRSVGVSELENMAHETGGGGSCENVELTVIGEFKIEKPVGSEADRIKKGWWNPSTLDFEAVVQEEKITDFWTCASFGEFVGAIQGVGKKKTNAISRVNIVTHGGQKMIAFHGKVNGSNGDVSLSNAKKWDDPKKALDSAALNQLRTLPGLLSELKAKFCKNAVIFIYACGAGAGSSMLLLQDLHKIFDVRVKGPHHKSVWYRPKPTKPIDRPWTALGPPPPAKPPTNIAKGFRHLDKGMRAF